MRYKQRKWQSHILQFLDLLFLFIYTVVDFSFFNNTKLENMKKSFFLNYSLSVLLIRFKRKKREWEKKGENDWEDLGKEEKKKKKKPKLKL